MRVRLKGLNRVVKKNAEGKTVTYYYAWKGGPRLPGKPGEPEFIAAFNEAIKKKVDMPKGTIQAVLNAYQDSPKFLDLAERTRRDYAKHIRKIELEFGDFPVSALPDKRTRAEFLAWRDRMAMTSRRQADYVFSTFAAILAWAADRGITECSPCERVGRTYRGSRADSVWTVADEEALMAKAPERIKLAYLLAVWTGQRQGDLLRLTWNAYDGTHIRLKQSKTGRRVVIPVSGVLKAELDRTAENKVAVTILTTTKGTPWTSMGFSATWRKTLAAAKITGLTFHDLRGTAVTRLALAGCSEAEIATFTGHSLRDVAAILDAHYLSRDAMLAESALAKRERHEAGTKLPNSSK